MTFIQLVDAHSDKIDEIAALAEEYQAATEGKRTGRRFIRMVDRNDPRRFVTAVFFDSYESAMENSQLPETQELAGKMAALVDGPVTFHDLDVIDDSESESESE
ncbi:MAG: hypothetical protein M3Q98_14065 [Actinomycetota bacterium]|nr:hypothetical protein [Actinomycetota bacterium]